ncbi:hypothetical protein [Nocardiopsis rhodophaea]
MTGRRFDGLSRGPLRRVGADPGAEFGEGFRSTVGVSLTSCLP